MSLTAGVFCYEFNKFRTKMWFSSIGRMCRSFHSSFPRQAVDKALLSKLRKKTGFPFINCRKALEKFDNDLQKAEQWLREEAQKEGWAKASKLQGRAMSQGLVGVMIENNMAAMVEVNCETDFVARNAKFRELVSKAANMCLQHGKGHLENKLLLNKAQLSEVSGGESGTLADLVALTVGNVGENMAPRRAAFLRAAEPTKLGTYVHSTGPHQIKDNQCIMGKYGALTNFSRAESTVEGVISSEEIGRQLCQHIVGMNPDCIEPPVEPDAEPDAEPNDEEPDKEGQLENQNDSQEVKEERAMVLQEFLLDSTLTVKGYLEQNQAQILDFIRFECGESLGEDENQ